MNRHVRALGAGVLVAAFGVSGVACASGVEPPTTTTITNPEPSPKAADYAVENTVRQTWGDEASLSRVLLIEAIAGLPDAPFARERLLQTDAQIGDLMASFYKPVIAAEIQGLLRERTDVLLDLAAATKVSDDLGVAGANARLRANAVELSALLANGIAGPVDLEQLLRGLLTAQGDFLRKEIAARAAGDFRTATLLHDTYELHVGLLSDTLAGVIVNTRPDLVAASGLSPEQRGLYDATNDLWRGHEGLTRAWLVSAVAGLPDAIELMNELLHNQVAIGAFLKTHYGADVGNGAAALLGLHVVLTDGFVHAAKANDRARMASIQQQLYDNADAIGALLMGVNPYWTDVGSRMRSDVDHTLNQVTARVVQDWRLDLASYDLAANDGQKMADAMANGMIKQGVGGFR